MLDNVAKPDNIFNISLQEEHILVVAFACYFNCVSNVL